MIGEVLLEGAAINVLLRSQGRALLTPQQSCIVSRHLLLIGIIHTKIKRWKPPSPHPNSSLRSRHPFQTQPTQLTYHIISHFLSRQICQGSIEQNRPANGSADHHTTTSAAQLIHNATKLPQPSAIEALVLSHASNSIPKDRFQHPGTWEAKCQQSPPKKLEERGENICESQVTLTMGKGKRPTASNLMWPPQIISHPTHCFQPSRSL